MDGFSVGSSHACDSECESDLLQISVHGRPFLQFPGYLQYAICVPVYFLDEDLVRVIKYIFQFNFDLIKSCLTDHESVSLHSCSLLDKMSYCKSRSVIPIKTCTTMPGFPNFEIT